MTKSGFDLDEIERLLAATKYVFSHVEDYAEAVEAYHAGLRKASPAMIARLRYLEIENALMADNGCHLEAVISELRAENARLKKLTIPTWFYHPDYPEYCKFDPSEVIDEDYDPLPGDHVFEIDCAVALPSIWCAVHVSNDPDADERFTYTEHASEAEARAALGEPQ